MTSMVAVRGGEGEPKPARPPSEAAAVAWGPRTRR